MKIEIRREEDAPDPCLICERKRTGLDIGVLAVIKQIGPNTEPVVQFVICGVCAAKIAIIVTRHHLEVQQRAPQQRAPPSLLSSDGRGGGW